MDRVSPPTFRTFVLIPYGTNGEYQGGSDESNYVYREIIVPAVKRAIGDDSVKPNIIREVDRNLGGSITAAIVKSLLESDVVIADVTGRNPNVFLELGIRYALRNKVTILIAQQGTAIPFDIHGYRYIEYNKYKPEEARRKISAFIRQGLKEESHSDSVVFEVFPNLSVVIPGVLASYGREPQKSAEVMSWQEYLGRIDWVCRLLEDPVNNGHFVPDALIGISNGGLIVADLVGRRCLRGTPILSLWAKRTNLDSASRFRYFDNPYNDSVIMALKDYVGRVHKEEPATVLLVDDHLGTGNTALQAIAYLKDRLGESTKILFIPLVSRRLEYISVNEEFLPYEYGSIGGKPIFATTKAEFVNKLNTRTSYFPYFNKEISKGDQERPLSNGSFVFEPLVGEGLCDGEHPAMEEAVQIS